MAQAPLTPVLEADPDLGALLSESERSAALAAILAPRRELSAGDPLATSEDARATMLVVGGMLTCSIGVEGTRVTEIAGPHDVLRPVVLDDAAFLRAGREPWRAAEGGATVLVLDRGFLEGAMRFPEVGLALADRLAQRGECLLRQLAISHVRRLDQRLEWALWLLVERFGRVVPAGVALDLPLTHQLLAEVVGARRPSVTAALGELREGRRVVRDERNRFVLCGARPSFAPV